MKHILGWSHLVPFAVAWPRTEEHSDSFSISNFHGFILLLGGGVQLRGVQLYAHLNSLDIIKKTKGIRFDRTFSGADLARRQWGLTLKGGGGGCEWGLGVGWTVDLTLRKKREQKWIPTGDLQPR